jgi:CubicO group peptidase (beta-lactamase class C family)
MANSIERKSTARAARPTRRWFLLGSCSSSSRISSAVATIVILAVTPVTACSAQQPSARMDQIIQYYVASNSFAGAILVAQDGKILLDKGYGDADLEWRVPNSPATKFQIASITKQFTAASILLLAERGKLNVNDPVKKYMPDAPPAWDKVTIYSVLTHASGIPEKYDGITSWTRVWLPTN